MVELTVALLAGLIVAMGIVGLSREATTTFHEEARASAAEAALRAAIDRLRADLQRAGYMSTGNIWADQNIATAPGQPNLGTGITLAGVTHLQSIHLVQGGSVASNGLALSGTNGLSPDVIEIAGNLSTADQFDVALVPQPGGCIHIDLSPSSPAMYRLLAGGAGELQNAFQPDTSKQFLIRLVDDSGRSQFLVTCAGVAATGLEANGWPYVAVDTSAAGTPLQTAQNTGTVGGLSGYAAGRAWVNPVQVVRWEITSSGGAGDHAEPAQFVTASELANGTSDPNKYDLMRTLLAADLSATSLKEVVAEYAVDLAFAFTVDTTNAVIPPGEPLPPIVASYPFTDTLNNGPIAAAVTSGNVATARPQRIRSVRVRLATRAAQADRTMTIPVQPALGDSYLYRYCILPIGNSCPSPPDTTARWARARTLTTEVALPNQARTFY